MSDNTQLEQGTYEILQNRLNKQGEDLRNRVHQLNEARKSTFGSVDHTLVGNTRITTAHNCTPRDIFSLENLCLFGYNVQMGLKSEVKVPDVFSLFEYKNHEFHQVEGGWITNKQFEEDFRNLYKYYRNTVFLKFARIGSHLYMVFQVGKNVEDIKAFKWLINGGELTYIDNRSEHEYQMPGRWEFHWERATRDMHREGEHPHVSIMDRVFVETVGGDLTIKVEDNTKTGLGIYAEHVEDPEQKLDDAEYYYADLGNLIVLKIKPFREEQFRYFVFNEKLQDVKRIDALEDSCLMLPEDHGIIFSKGYYLQTGEFKYFDSDLRNMEFWQRIPSPNGEDYLFAFYNRVSGTYILMSYNLIDQKVDSPIMCNGYALFEDGELCYFRSEDEPRKHHQIQIWQTPYVSPDFQPEVHTDDYLFKIGNKDIVRAMAECHEVLAMIERDEVYSSLYVELTKKSKDILDSWFWINRKEAFQLDEPLKGILETASSAIEEFEKVSRLKKNTAVQVAEISAKVETLFTWINRTIFKDVNEFVKGLSELRTLRGEVISLRELRYVDLELVDQFEQEIAEKNDKLSQKCVEFLLKDDALDPYQNRAAALAEGLEAIGKVADADSLSEELTAASGELEMLIEIVSNLRIEDSTQTTRIIDSISAIYTDLNKVNAQLKKKRKELLGTEKVAEFGVQMKLLDQAMVNYIDVSETPEKCEEYMNKLMVQLEELEGKFVDFEEFLGQLAEKREEVYSAFESKKVSLIEARNKRAVGLQNAAERLLKGIDHRVSGLEDVIEINGYFAGDLMVDKVRDIVNLLLELGDSVKADDVQSRLKTIRENAVRQLKDRKELFVDGKDVIRLGKYAFNVNRQELDLTMIYRDQAMYFHLTGTNFFERVSMPDFDSTQAVWQQSLVSENPAVYRAEYLAYSIFQSLQAEGTLTEEVILESTHEQLLSLVREIMTPRFTEGYVKGVHDEDAARILDALVRLSHHMGLLRYTPEARSAAMIWWNHFLSPEDRQLLEHRLKGIGYILQVFPESRDYGDLMEDIEKRLQGFLETHGLFEVSIASQAAEYLFYELSVHEKPVISKEAGDIVDQFKAFLKKQKKQKALEASLQGLSDNPDNQFELCRNWVSAFVKQEMDAHAAEFIDEAATILFLDDFDPSRVAAVSGKEVLQGMMGEHNRIKEGMLEVDFIEFMHRMESYILETVPRYQRFHALKTELIKVFRDDIRLDEFKPRVLSSFVRNKLIDEVYLPMIGANLAKQIGVAGEDKRTDLMGLLLLISPPGYGKTTLMEYIASRLGLVFMKINGPAIGHRITSLDPNEAPNSAAREEMEKLSLAFEMGDNVMIYLDDIQHCNPEFLQKFISLCDAQRKIEGVYKGKSKTYDLRGKKVCVVMAGNPYTESGEKFRIPDMLANRADIYNLGDILGDSGAAFKLSYLENCLTSNPVLNKLSGKSQKDLYALIKLAETGSREGLEFESNHSPEEVNEYVNVLKKLITVRDVILKVNLEYIRSAGMEDVYRTEPAFKLQGSYRDMNKIAEKTQSIMNEDELKTLVLSHYESESQTLTTGAEANLLRFKELVGWMNDAEKKRWKEIKQTFMKQQKLAGAGKNQFGQVLAQMSAFTEGLESIKNVLEEGLRNGKEE